MVLTKIIIHELKKERDSNEVELILSDETIPINNDSIALVQALSDTYKSDKILYAVFDNSEGKYFPEKFSEYRNTEREEEDFINLESF